MPAPKVSDKTKKAVSESPGRSKLRRSVRSILGGKDADPKEVEKVTTKVWLKHLKRKGVSGAGIAMSAIMEVINQQDEDIRLKKRKRGFRK